MDRKYWRKGYRYRSYKEKILCMFNCSFRREEREIEIEVIFEKMIVENFLEYMEEIYRFENLNGF